jgi:hypothetical protein
MATTRRTVLRSAAALAGGMLAGSPPTKLVASVSEKAELLPTVVLGPHRVTRLILGSNPFNGFCYAIPSLSAHMKEWSTPETIARVLQRADQCGINTWQFSYYENSLAALRLHQDQGGRLQWILLTGGVMQGDPARVREVAGLGPLAIVHHGGVTDRQFRAGRMSEVQEYLKLIRDTGVLVGLSTHLPEVVDFVEDHDWDVDFFMTSFYQLSRSEQQIRDMLGELPLGSVFLEGDPARMCRAIRSTTKPCLAFKVLASGRRAESPERLEESLRYALDQIKPQDAIIVGMYPRFKDEVAENAEAFRRVSALENAARPIQSS